MIRIKRGLNIPIQGQPEQVISAEPWIDSVALIGPDYVGMKPTMEVKEGDSVKLGQLLFTDKKNPGVRYTAPGCGKVRAINRGQKRAFLSVVIGLEGDEAENFTQFSDSEIPGLSREKVFENLVTTGLWTALRARPYSHVPAIDSQPSSLFITAIDTEPLALDPEVVLKDRQEDFVRGIKILAKLAPKTFVVKKESGDFKKKAELNDVKFVSFEGPHPAGLPGTHIHFLDPVGPKKTVWHIGYQDVIAIGEVFRTGKYPTQRVVSVAGPQVERPTLLKTRVGANLDALLKGLVKPGQNRVISGSPLSGRKAEQAMNFLGRYHRQVSVLKEGTDREFLGWQGPGFDKFSSKRVFLSSLIPGKKFPMTTNLHGSKRAMVPIGMYEKVMPLDILPTFLLRSLAVNDAEQAKALGILELDEEDLGLCTFVCPGKTDYGPILRSNLTKIEKEG